MTSSRTWTPANGIVVTVGPLFHTDLSTHRTSPRTALDTMALRQLDNAQLDYLDYDYVTGDKWQSLKGCMERDFGSESLRILDLGGGNGRLADRLTAAYENVEVTVLDNSELLLGKNRPHPRKRLVLASIANAENELRNQRYDLICVNWVLHHLIGDTPSETDALVDEALSTSRNLLSDNGRISVFEHMYDGILVDDLPGQLIYRITKSRILAEPARRMGANTAGVGVRFRSKRAWKNTFDRLGLTVLRYCDADPREMKLSWRVCLHMTNLRDGHFWLTA